MTVIETQLRQQITLEQYKALPEGPPKSEFEQGTLIPMTQPSPEHQDLFLELAHLLRRHVRRNNLGRVFAEPDVYLPNGEAYIPDIVFLSTDRLRLLDETDKAIHGTPDLCIEILSARPGRDRVEKFEVYQRNVLPWYWLADPVTFDIEEYKLTEAGYVRTASVLGGHDFQPLLFPGLVVNLKNLVDEK
jgi:Uma2 family endonuclease